jgi:intracellular sulfur oxidation DsrE/DsrF family protein
MKTLQSIGVLCALMLVFASCEQQNKELTDLTAVEAVGEKTIEAPAELIINLISDPVEDPHSSLMGLHLAQNVRKNGQEVMVFLNVHGVKVMGPGAGTLEFHDENLQQVLTDLMADGGVVRACPHCMMAHDIEAKDLLEGVQVMENAIMVEKIKNNPTVFTY